MLCGRRGCHRPGRHEGSQGRLGRDGGEGRRVGVSCAPSRELHKEGPIIRRKSESQVENGVGAVD